MSYDNTIPPAPPTCVDCNRNYRNCLSCYNDSFCDACVSPTALYHLDLNLCVESTECDQPLTSYPLGRYCKNCKVGCELCSNDTDCWKCSTGTLDSDNATCLAACRLYTTQKNATHCIDCPRNCETCNYTATSNTTTLTSLTQPLQCEQCLSGYFFDTQRKCVQCNKQKEIPINDTCHICQVSNCKTCNNTVDICVDFIDQYYVNTTGGCSLCQLPLTYTVNKTCLPCEVPNCEICDKSNLQLCVTCQKGFYKEGLVCAPRFFQILKHSFSSDSLEISIKFEHKIKEFNNSNFIPTVQEPNNTNSRVNLSVITSTKDASDPRLYRIKVDKLPKKSELDLNLTVLDSFNVLSSEKATYTLNPNNTTLIFDRLSRYIPDSAELSATASAAVTTTTTVLMAIGSVLAFNYAVIMMKIYQMMEFMLLYNVEYPYNFSRFIDLFKTTNPLKMLPDAFESLYDDTCQVLGHKFVIQEMGC